MRLEYTMIVYPQKNDTIVILGLFLERGAECSQEASSGYLQAYRESIEKSID